MNEPARIMENEEDLNFTGRESNKELTNFRMWGKSKHQQYFTPNPLCQAIHEMLLPAIACRDNMPGYSILDPTCGSGRLLVPWKKAKAGVIGIELDKETALAAKRLLGKESVRTGDILDYARHLENFHVAVSNPPYGILWQVQDHPFGFEATHYGGSIESQAATIEIISKALTHNGILAAIIPSSSFQNAKDSKLRDHLYGNYRMLLKATLKNVFKEEYGIDVLVDLVVAQRDYGPDNGSYKKIELDIIKDLGWKNQLINSMHEILKDEEIYLHPYGSKAVVPFLDTLQEVPVENTVNVIPKGIKAGISSTALLDFLNEVTEEYNPVLGIPTGLLDAYLSPPSLMKRGLEASQGLLETIGFEVEVRDKDKAKMERLRRKYDYLGIPMYRPKPHQLLAYFFNQEYKAKATVKDEDGKVLFKKNKSYLLHPSWVRNRETVKLQDATDVGRKKKVTIKTEVDRGYLSIKTETEQGERTFNEIKIEEIKLFTEAFKLPSIPDINDEHPVKVEHLRKRIKKQFPFLFDYQQEDLARLGMKPFGYLGYDMGGGKTVSAACWATLRNYKNVLVVCQSGLVQNWINELKKFGFKIQKFTTHASVTRLQAQKRGKEKNQETTFYITSYEFLSLDTGKEFDPWDCIEYDKDGNERRASRGNTSEKCPLCKKDHATVISECPRCESKEAWTGNVCHKCGYTAYTYTSRKKIYPAYKRVKKLFSCVIVDEAQIAKSKNTCRGRAVRAMKCKGKLLLTGTLMKGYIHDVYWNVGWLLGYNNPLFPYPYRGGSKRFLNEFGTFEYVTQEFEDSLHEGRAKLIPEVSNLNRFWRLISSFTIRRLKDSMVELPEKHREILLLPMDQTHKQLYDRYQTWATDVIRDAIQIASRNGGEVNMGLISSALWKLRFAATCPNAGAYLCKPPGPQVCLERSQWNKVKKVIELAKEVRKKGEKMIVFSGLRPMVSAICKGLRNAGISFIPILASHKTGERFQMIEDFSHDESVTAIVAGLNVLNRGFTITAASHVIITDIEYSPESVLQAEDRAHRTGQQKEVYVYYLLSNKTIDQVMLELILKKQMAISNAIDGKAVHKDVAELLENMSGNIQLEIAKRIVEAEETKFIEVEETPSDEAIEADIIIEKPELTAERQPFEAGSEEIFETLYQLKMEMKSRDKKKTEVSEAQLSLF